MISTCQSSVYDDMKAYWKLVEEDDLGRNLNNKNCFALFELGFNPLTLLVATHQDYMNLYKHYQGITQIIKQLPSRIRSHATRECMTRLSNCISFRSHLLFLLDDLHLYRVKEFERWVSRNAKLQQCLINIMREAKISTLSIAKALCDNLRPLKRQLEDAAEYTKEEKMLL